MSDLTMATLRQVIIGAGQEISRLLGYEEGSGQTPEAPKSVPLNME
jgi:hypothetical protein